MGSLVEYITSKQFGAKSEAMIIEVFQEQMIETKNSLAALDCTKLEVYFPERPHLQDIVQKLVDDLRNERAEEEQQSERKAELNFSIDREILQSPNYRLLRVELDHGICSGSFGDLIQYCAAILLINNPGRTFSHPDHQQVVRQLHSEFGILFKLQDTCNDFTKKLSDRVDYCKRSGSGTPRSAKRKVMNKKTRSGGKKAMEQKGEVISINEALDVIENATPVSFRKTSETVNLASSEAYEAEMECKENTFIPSKKKLVVESDSEPKTSDKILKRQLGNRKSKR